MLNFVENTKTLIVMGKKHLQYKIINYNIEHSISEFI